MLIKNLKLSWANLKKIHIKDIEGQAERRFAGVVKDDPRKIVLDVYDCSDGRNTAVRQVLNEIPFVNAISSAGNVVYNPNERASVVLAHGGSNYSRCGAVDHACNEDSDKYHAIKKNVKKNPIENAKTQLEKVPEKYRAGILYFNHEKCEIEKHGKREASYPKSFFCDFLFEELKDSLAHRFTEEEKERMTRGQHPDFILLTNLSARYPAFNLFRVDLQRNKFDDIIADSMAYAMDHALRGEGSFQNTQTAFLVFRKNQKLSDGLADFLEDGDFIKSYMERGGNVYIVTAGDLPSDKTIYQFEIKKVEKKS